MLALVTCAGAVGADTDLPPLIDQPGDVDPAVCDVPTVDSTRFHHISPRGARRAARALRSRCA